MILRHVPELLVAELLLYHHGTADTKPSCA